MKTSIAKFLKDRFPRSDVREDIMAHAIVEHICTAEFSALYARRNPSLPDLGLGESVNFKWSNAMSSLTDAMAAAITTLKSTAGAGGPTADQITAQIHTVVDPAVANLTSQIAGITASESDDAAKIVDINAALAEFTTAFAPASTPTPAEAAAGSTAATLATAAGA